jgi:aarF domain-containing kinase
MKHSDHFAGWQLMRPYNKNKMVNENASRKDVIASQLELKSKMKDMMKDTQNFPK